MFGDNYLKSKIRSYNNKITSNLKNIENNSNNQSKKRFDCICRTLIVIDSVFTSGKNYYPQIFLEECKYKIKEIEIKSFITDDLESSSSDDFE